MELKGENLKNLSHISRAQKAFELQSGKFEMSETAVARFYERFFKESEKVLGYPVSKDERESLFELLKSTSKKGFCLTQPFKFIGEKFSVFDEKGEVEALVPFDKGAELKEALESGKVLNFRELGGYTVSLFPHEAKVLCERGLLQTHLDGRIFSLAQMAYDEQMGVVLEAGDVVF